MSDDGNGHSSRREFRRNEARTAFPWSYAPFLGVIRSSAFPQFPATRITAHGFLAMEYAVGVVCKVQVQLEPALEYETGL
ncbi:hypothetical protein RhiirA5_436713 [Rhizophagus irregularis]|uniref:Uncharacterized protein n=1 Tax=Rhizophagus irregularis TaxID=588596 RepID=A0A2N0NLL5_9GLOM|nr:hypothetical protein RhiirA5_436713 [Rhizophagus irregularis]